MQRPRLKTLLAVICLALTTSANAHLFTPASKTDKEYLSELYQKLGINPPRYDLASRRLQNDEWTIFGEVFAQGSSQVGRYAIPLLATALSTTENIPTKVLADIQHSLRHYISDHQRTAREHDTDVALALWLIQYHQQPKQARDAFLISGLEESSAIRAVAVNLLANYGDLHTASKLGSALHKTTEKQKLSAALRSARMRLWFRLQMQMRSEPHQVKLLRQAIAPFLRQGVHSIGLNQSYFEWLLWQTSNLSGAQALALLQETSTHPKLTLPWRNAAKSYLARMQARFSGK